MSDNPFNAPQSQPSNVNLPPAPMQRPTLLTVILVFAMIIGGFGFVCNFVSMGSLFLQEQMLALNDSAIPPTEDMLAARKELIDLSKPMVIPSIVFGLINFIVAPLLFISALMCFNRKPSGRSLLSKALLLAAILFTVRTAWGMVHQMSINDKMMELQIRNGGPNAAGMEGMMKSFQTVGLVIGLGFFLLMLGYYIFSWFYVNKPHVRAWFGQ